jgi:signal transduction histidine kinase
MAGMMGKQEDRGVKPDNKDEAFQALLDIGLSAQDARDAEEQLYGILQTLMGLFKADSAELLLREGNELAVFMSPGVEEDASNRFTLNVGQGYAGKIAETKAYLYVRDAQTDPVVISPYIKNAGIRSMLGVPIVYGGEAIGVLHLDWLRTHLFSELELQLLKVAAERCASAIAVARMGELNEELNKQSDIYLDIIERDIMGLNMAMLQDLDTVLSIPDLDEEAKDTLEGVKHNMKESETIVDNVRILHHTLSEDLPLETMDLDELLEDAIKEVKWPETKNVEIHYSSQLGRAVNSTLLLKEVFFTLIYNAVMCSREDVTITINVDKMQIDDSPYYAISIIDDAQQIPDDIKDDLFTFNLGVTQAHGKALPMFLVRLVLDRMGGDIRVENRVRGDYRKGTEFVITLPAIEGKAIPES